MMHPSHLVSLGAGGDDLLGLFYFFFVRLFSYFFTIYNKTMMTRVPKVGRTFCSVLNALTPPLCLLTIFTTHLLLSVCDIAVGM